MRDTYSEDRKLVRRLARGHERAFDPYVDEYYPRLCRFAFTRVARDAAAAPSAVLPTCGLTADQESGALLVRALQAEAGRKRQ